jgi:hypothetical protein
MAGSKVTTAVDAYAFGIMAWEIFTSKRAYAGERRSVGAPVSPLSLGCTLFPSLSCAPQHRSMTQFHP